LLLSLRTRLFSSNGHGFETSVDVEFEIVAAALRFIFCS